VSDGLKRRIAGTIVLTALGLVLLPLVFDFADPEKIDRSSKIPQPPSLDIKNIVKAVKPDQVETKSDLKSLFDTFLSDATDGLPKAWVVQVASFVDEGKANELRGALVNRDYKAFSKKVKIDGRDHFRVYIGPKIDKRNALKVKDAVDTEFNTESIVLNYVP
jgi:DedD protein